MRGMNNKRRKQKLLFVGTSLVVQWLRLHAPNARGGPGSVPGQRTRSHGPQLRVLMPKQRTGTAK